MATVYRLQRLSAYMSDLRVIGEPVPDDAWRDVPVLAYDEYDRAHRAARDMARAEHVAYRVVEMSMRVVAVFDLHDGKSDMS